MTTVAAVVKVELKAALRACTSQGRSPCRDLLRVAERDSDAELRLDALRAAARDARTPVEQSALSVVAKRIATSDAVAKNREFSEQLLRMLADSTRTEPTH